MMSNFSDSDIITLNITYDDNRPTMFYNFKCIKTKPLFYSLFTCIFTICSVLTKILFIYIDRNHNLSSNREIQNFRVLKSFFIDRTVAQRVITMFLYLQIYNFCNNLEVTLDPTLFVIIVAVIVVFDYVEHTYISFIILSFCFIQFTQKSEIISQQTNEIQYLSCCDVKIEGGFDLDPGIPGKLIDLKNTIYSPVNIGKCRLCKYNYTAETHSTSRDLAIFISMGESQAIVPRIRSLRTAGCKAKILLFTDSKKSFPERFANCGIDIVRLKLSKRINKDQIIMMRYIIISDILKKYGSAFDRVLYCDGFDTFSQYDPFINVSKDPYALHVSPERFLHMSSPWSRMWAQDLTGLDFDKFFGRHQIYCAGVFMGGVKAMEMINGLIGSTIGRDFQMAVNDQIFFDWIFLTQIPKILNITVIENYNLASIHFTNGDYDNAEIGKICYKHTSLCPSVLHQIDRRKELEVKFTKVCP